MDLGLKNKKILVTGSSRGIGLSIARAFLTEGAKVCIVSRGSKELVQSTKLLEEEFGSNIIISSVCDCSNISDLKKLKKVILAEFGSLDVLVSNVGDGRSISDAIPEESHWNFVWKNNFDSSINSARVFLPLLKIKKGCILFISSIAGMESIGAPVDYSTSKTAIIALAKNLSKKVATDVRVNVLSPGNIWFPGGSWDNKIKEDSKAVNIMLKSKVPMKRFGTPDEIADAAIFLCSKRASFITGSTLTIDGGQTVSII